MGGTACGTGVAVAVGLADGVTEVTAFGVVEAAGFPQCQRLSRDGVDTVGMAFDHRLPTAQRLRPIPPDRGLLRVFEQRRGFGGEPYDGLGEQSVGFHEPLTRMLAFCVDGPGE